MRLINKIEGEKISIVVPNLVRNTKLNKMYNIELEEMLGETGVMLSAPIHESVMEETLSEKGKTIFETASKKAENMQEVYGEIIGAILSK
jgi:chromosome partitioning protein